MTDEQEPRTAEQREEAESLAFWSAFNGEFLSALLGGFADRRATREGTSDD